MNKAPGKKTIVFDFDGTIVDSMEAFADIAAKVMPKRHCVDEDTARKLYMETSGIPFFQQLEQIFPNDDANRETAEEFERIKLESYFDKPAFEDAPDVVRHLRSLGIKAVVSSNNFQELVDRLTDKLGIEFDMVLGYKPGFAKGSDHFSHIEKELGVKRDDMIFVGDSIKDGERAKGFGIEFIAKEGIFPGEEFKNKFPGARVISNLTELKEIFK